MPMNLVSRFCKGQKTQNAGTKINVLIPPKRGYKTVVESVVVTTSTTAHTLTFFRPLGSTTVSAAALASASTFNITANPGTAMLGPNGTASQLAANTMAANDFYALELPDGTFFVDLVSSISTLVVTPTATIPTNGISAGAAFWMFGILSDNYPRDPEALRHMTLNCLASTQNVFSDTEGGLCITDGVFEPILLQIDNATAASTIQIVTGGYVKA